MEEIEKIECKAMKQVVDYILGRRDWRQSKSLPVGSQLGHLLACTGH